MPKEQNNLLIGRTIVGITWLTEAEAEAQGIPNYSMAHEPVQKILLDDGTYITALRDPEGNGSGFLILGKGAKSWNISPKRK